MCSLFRFVLIKLRHCGHLALSSCLMLRAKHNINMFGCIEGLRPACQSFVFYYTVLSCVALCVMIVTSCDCQLDFDKGLLLLL